MSTPLAENPTPPGDEPLTDRERHILEFEKRWWHYASVKEDTIEDEFGMTPVEYYMVLNELIDKPAAYAADPALVRRLQHYRGSSR